ncbi:MAG: DNA topoisomerase IB [Nocardiopsaceae bacterium]|nr:DNA topoisomerase IB [Nocardiopsaceae bacterium]
MCDKEPGGPTEPGEGLHRSDPDGPGISRTRCGRGFRYVGPDGAPLTDPEELSRVKALAIPPAWREVWICPQPDGHLQAVGTDEAGRRQYVYHQEWQKRREVVKYDRMLDFAERLPVIRAQIAEHLHLQGMVRERVLATAVRLVDLGFFRAGGEGYARANDTYGVASLLREHVHRTRGQVVFDYPAKGGKRRRLELVEPDVERVIAVLQRHRSAGEGLLAYRVGDGWHDVRSDDVNDYLRELSGGDYTVKEFRTWHATVLAAVGVAVATRAESDTATKRLITHVTREVAEYLGNTPAVARGSYVDPRIFRLYRRGITIADALTGLGSAADFGEPATQGEVETAVRGMLREHKDA